MNTQNAFFFSNWGWSSIWKWSPKCLAALQLLSASKSVVVWSFYFKNWFVLLLLVPEGLYRHPLSQVVLFLNENTGFLCPWRFPIVEAWFLFSVPVCFDIGLDIPCARKRFSYIALWTKHISCFVVAVLDFMQGNIFHWKRHHTKT